MILDITCPHCGTVVGLDSGLCYGPKAGDGGKPLCRFGKDEHGRITVDCAACGGRSLRNPDFPLPLKVGQWVWVAVHLGGSLWNSCRCSVVGFDGETAALWGLGMMHFVSRKDVHPTEAMADADTIARTEGGKGTRGRS